MKIVTMIIGIRHMVLAMMIIADCKLIYNESVGRNLQGKPL